MYKNNTVQAFCCFFYDKVIFCRRYNKAGGIIILLLFLSENIRSMKKILNNLLHRLKEDSLNKRVGNSTREVEYKEKREIKTCLVFWSADTDQNKWFRKLESDFAGVKMWLVIRMASAPETRMLPIAPPWAVAMAQMVS